MSADPNVLRLRLINVLALSSITPFTKEVARDAIVAHRIAGAVCARVPAVDGKIRCFADYFADVFGEDLAGKQVKPKAACKAPAGQ